MRVLRPLRLACVVGLYAIVASCGAQTVEPPQTAPVQTFRFELDAADAAMPSWIVLLRSDGTGLYWPTLTAKYGEVPLRISEATWKRVRAGAAAVVENRCETKLKNIAKTGVKDVEYIDGTVPGAHVDCTFNYSDDDALNAAADAMEAIAETMRIGDRLQHELRYDRLGLDAEMDSLVDEVKAGRAIEVQNIAPVLQGLVADERVMERVRRKAARLLGEAGAVEKQKP